MLHRPCARQSASPVRARLICAFLQGHHKGDSL
jgi:hypothetical protein